MISAAGRAGLGPVASALVRTSTNTRAAVVADVGPGETASLDALRRSVADDDVQVIAVQPDIEAWIQAGFPTWKRGQPIPDIATAQLRDVLAAGNGFEQFVEFLTLHSTTASDAHRDSR